MALVEEGVSGGLCFGGGGWLTGGGRWGTGRVDLSCRLGVGGWLLREKTVLRGNKETMK